MARSSFASVVFASVIALSAGFAQAGTVTIKYRVFPDGSNILPPEVVTGSVKDTAKATLYSKTSGVAYEFLFWNIGGRLNLDPTINYTPPKKDFATAWYLQTGSGPGSPCQPNCAVATWAFTLSGDRVLKGVTPIGSVTPASAWTSGSTSVSTMGGPVTVTAADTVTSPAGAQQFVKWVVLAGKAVPGKSFSVPAQTNSDDIGFFRLEPAGPTKPIYPPCPPRANPNEYTCY